MAQPITWSEAWAGAGWVCSSPCSFPSLEVRFKCDWKRKLFSTNYTVVSEMVVTDGREAEAHTILCNIFLVTMMLNQKRYFCGDQT
ncbi:MAG: hypothetical protein ACI3ZY_01510 [Parabacteroides sp.]